MLVVFPFEVIFKIQILKFLNSNVVFIDKMTSNGKLPTTKFNNFSRSTKFILVVWSFFISRDGSNIIYKSCTSLVVS
jgi:hypothetical protein